MNIVYYSSLIFTDCDFPLIREFQQKGVKVFYYIEVVTNRCCLGLFDLNSYKDKIGIYRASNFKEFLFYNKYLDLENVFLVFRSPKLTDVRNWKTYYKLCRQITRQKPDAFHFTNPLGVSELFLYYFRKIMVLTVHDPFLHSGHESRINSIKRRFAFKIVPKLVLLNKNQASEFSCTYKIPKSHIYFNKLGVYTCLNYIFEQSRCIEKYSEPYILYYGFIAPYKGIDVLCQAMELVHERYPKIKCVIAGKGKLYFDFTKYKDADYIRLYNRFIFVDELVSLINNSQFVICPYKDATQSGVISSCFAFAKPVIATKVGGLGESIIDDVTGKLVERNNPNELAEAIIQLSLSPEKIKKYSINITKRFWKGERDWSTIVNKYLLIYK